MGTAWLITGIAIVLVIRYQRKVRGGYSYVLRSAAPISSKIIPMPARYKEILINYFPYYNKLTPAHQSKFEQKLLYIIYSKVFIPRNFDQVTDEMKVLISAAAVQLTLGLDGIYLSHFRKILIYPDDYYSSITKRFHKGEVNPAFGAIVLSWHSFVMGYLKPYRDGVNLGLHEMAHALRLENIVRNNEYQFFDEKLLWRLDQFGEKVCDIEEHEQVRFFRPYACSNHQEFFAVAIENFFERSQQLKEEMPELHAILCSLLNQDPTNYSSSPSNTKAA